MLLALMPISEMKDLTCLDLNPASWLAMLWTFSQKICHASMWSGQTNLIEEAWSTFPALRYVSWAWTQRMLKKANDNASPSFMAELLERQQTVGASNEEEIRLNVANTVYAAAPDTTISAAQTFFYLITTHSEVQAKAHEELDRVLGTPPRLPTFEDRPVLPYIEAIYREVMRWCPQAVAMGVPHATSEDEWYKGYFIPKGTTIFSNIWEMTHDERLYPDPVVFKPERFFQEHGNLNDDSQILAYGFGRRSFSVTGPLYRVLLRKLWLMMASVFSCFNLDKKNDRDENEIEIDEFEEIGLMMPKTPYECDTTPRSTKHHELIIETDRQ
ncbi:cytochrome P450 [Panaeolus papilionaceus]|nr:cytochrome P450 [Panaeolus papilionaceus]